MLKTTVVLAAGLIVGGGIVQGLHAQMKPPAYQIALIDIKDEAGYKAAVGDVRKHIEAAGGKFIVTAGAGGYASGGITSPINSQLPSRIVISEWPNIDAVKTDQADMKTLGEHAALRIYNVEGSSK
jgi:uncharacterized protein (DUF1330 family)